MMSVKVRFWRILGLIFAINLIAACATNTPIIGNIDAKNSAPLDLITSNITLPNLTLPNSTNSTNSSYQGRLSLRIATETPQSLYGAFMINGDAQRGELALNSPLGNTVAKLNWTPQTAVLSANNTTTSYLSTDALIATVTGTTLPLPALFDWLAGVSTPVEGWETDLSNMQNVDNRRLIAKRISPLPTVELRIALEQP
jgi:outer membrane lipoprotein LolB